jgi:acyl-CoA synthetase (AMP-forming)/AMP-acid ligase II
MTVPETISAAAPGPGGTDAEMLAGLTTAAARQLTLGDLLRENRRRFPLRTAIVCGDQRLTFPELDDRVNALAGVLRDRGAGVGGRVLWLGQNCHRFFELLFACAKIGAVVCPANWRQTADELNYVIADFAPAVICWQEEEIGPAVAGARAAAADSISWIQHDGSGPESYEALIASGRGTDDEEPVPEGQAVLAIYTAGFDGRAKAALLSHECLITISMVQGMVMGVRAGSDDVFLNSGPFFHIGDIVHALPYLHFGGTNVLMRRMNGTHACQLIEREKVTAAYLYGPIAAIVAEANAGQNYDLSSLRIPAGQPGVGSQSPLLAPPVTGYGQTEVGGRVTFSAFGGPADGAMGRTSPLAQVRLFDQAGREVPDGDVGELAVRGPVVMNGYLGDTRPPIGPAGWRRTGDLGRRERDGSISFIGVARRMLKSGVENIYPAEVEAVIRQHPAVAACAIIGIPDERWEQSVKAIVVLEPGAACTADDITEFCRARIASYKKPREVAFTAALPMTGGAVDYAALDREYGGGGYPGSGA